MLPIPQSLYKKNIKRWEKTQSAVGNSFWNKYGFKSQNKEGRSEAKGKFQCPQQNYNWWQRIAILLLVQSVLLSVLGLRNDIGYSVPKIQ